MLGAAEGIVLGFGEVDGVALNSLLGPKELEGASDGTDEGDTAAMVLKVETTVSLNTTSPMSTDFWISLTRLPSLTIDSNAALKELNILSSLQSAHVLETTVPTLTVLKEPDKKRRPDDDPELPLRLAPHNSLTTTDSTDSPDES